MSWAPKYTNNDFNKDEYRNSAIPVQQIARLLTAGFEKQDGKPLALFTGGGNGCGKSTFTQGALAAELSQKGYKPRDMEAFYEEVCKLAEENLMFSAVRSQAHDTMVNRGRYTWEAMTALFPELKAIETYPAPLVNMDMVAYLLNECIYHKHSDAEFLVRDHYYRALNGAPELCEALAKTGYSFVVDSTMSNPKKLTEAADKVAANGYDLNYAIFHADNAVERVMERGAREGRGITHADALRSQQKMPENFRTFVESAHKHKGFIGLYDSSSGTNQLLAHNGKTPELACLDPQKSITTYELDAGTLPRIIACDPKRYEMFRFGNVAQR